MTRLTSSEIWSKSKSSRRASALPRTTSKQTHRTQNFDHFFLSSSNRDLQPRQHYEWRVHYQWPWSCLQSIHKSEPRTAWDGGNKVWIGTTQAQPSTKIIPRGSSRREIEIKDDQGTQENTRTTSSSLRYSNEVASIPQKLLRPHDDDQDDRRGSIWPKVG